MTNVIEINAITGEEITSQLSKAELEKRQAIADALEAEKATEEQAKATAKAALLNRLGITADEAKLLLS